MTALPASILAAIQAPPAAGGGSAAAPSGGPAFLAVLDRMLGLGGQHNGPQLGPPAPGGKPGGTTRPVGEAPLVEPPDWLLPYAIDLADDKPVIVDPGAGPPVPPATIEAIEDIWGDVTPDGTKPVSPLPIGSQSDAPAPAAAAPADAAHPESPARWSGDAGPARGQAPTTQPDGRAARPVATDPDPPAPNAVAKPQAPAAAGTETDPALEGILVALARRQGPASVPSRHIDAPAIAAADPRAGLANSRSPVSGPETGDRHATRARATRPDAAAGRAAAASNAARDAANDKASDVLGRLLAAGRSSRAAPQAVTASGDGDGDAAVRAARPPAVAPVLLTVNEIGAPGQHAGVAPAATGAPRSALPASALPARPNVEAIAMRIAHQARGGSQRFEIELDPPELGRVEIRLEIARDGRMTTHLVVDRGDTLDALMRDGRGLERALQAHGLKLEDGGLQYQLRDQSSFAQHHRGHGAADDAAAPVERLAADCEAGTEPAGPVRRLALGGLDLTI